MLDHDLAMADKVFVVDLGFQVGSLFQDCGSDNGLLVKLKMVFDNLTKRANC